MDNLTHSLIGAALGQAGLKRKTGLAMPALIMAANLPDIDAGCVVYGIESLAMRRGLTHGPLALAILPLLLAGLLWWFDRWQTGRGTRPETRLPVHFGWLVALCYLGTFSHPLFDWFNTYGIRLLEPFSSRWFYGDTLFIIDIWILIALGTGLWRSRRRERENKPQWAFPAQIALTVVVAYVGLNMAISRASVAAVRAIDPQIDLAVASPVPLPSGGGTFSGALTMAIMGRSRVTLPSASVTPGSFARPKWQTRALANFRQVIRPCRRSCSGAGCRSLKRAQRAYC